MKVGLLLVTALVAVALSVMMWLIGVVPFDLYTSAFHVVSIYLGVSGVLTYQEWRRG